MLIREQIRLQAKKVALFLSLGIGLVTLGTFGGMLYMLERDGDSFAQDILAIEREMKRLTEEVHDKELAVLRYKSAVEKLNQRYNDRLAYCGAE
jgi:hypothetical protein